MRLRLGETGAIRRQRELMQFIECHLGAEQKVAAPPRHDSSGVREQQRQGIGRPTAYRPIRAISHQNARPMAPSIMIFDQFTALRWKVSARMMWWR